MTTNLTIFLNRAIMLIFTIESIKKIASQLSRIVKKRATILLIVFVKFSIICSTTVKKRATILLIVFVKFSIICSTTIANLFV